MVKRPLVINQRFGPNWAFYNADCVFAFRGLPDESVDFQVESLPFLSLYIYSDSIADLGNTESEEQFYEGYQFALAEKYRTLKPGRRMAIHCKDTMRYMSSHGYAGLYDFPGHIVRLCREVGFLFERWITIWKDPVIEMQRTKTYGLLHKSFCERAEVTRQGCTDYVLVFRKPAYQGDMEMVYGLLFPNERVIERCVQQWTNEGEIIQTPLKRDIRGRKHSAREELKYSFWSVENERRLDDIIYITQEKTIPGRLTTIHCTTQMMTTVVERFESVDGWKFHSRCALTDGSYLVTFRNWQGEFQNNVVKHRLQPPDVDYQKFEIVSHFQVIKNGEMEVIEEHKETWRESIIRGDEVHPDYVGTNPPIGWRDQNYYSILVWQRYASPVWFDLEGLPATHHDCWMDIVQTNVLNAKGVKEDEASKHICPLQLDLIRGLILEYTQPREIVADPYGGIGSTGYEAVKLGRRVIMSELKPEYWRTGCKNLINANIATLQKSDYMDI